METQVQQLEYANPSSLDNVAIIQDSEPGQLSTISPQKNFTNPLPKIKQKFSDFSERLPRYIIDFYNEYPFPIISFTLLVVTVNLLKILLAVTDAINDIPFASPIFELIGLGYVSWLVFRYFFKSETREEVANEIDSLKNQVTEEKA
ncbi:MAG: CAAD domain-containing protein [Nostoc sp. ChiSLP02]|nr:CAAD domain-containing protein [Nostoc sp. ChiSLP02]